MDNLDIIRNKIINYKHFTILIMLILVLFLSMVRVMEKKCDLTFCSILGGPFYLFSVFIIFLSLF